MARLTRLYQAWLRGVLFPGGLQITNYNPEKWTCLIFFKTPKPDKRLGTSDPSPLEPHQDRVSPLQRGVHRELKQVRALAVALAELCLSVALSVHLPHAPAGPEILVQHDGALGLDYLVAHPLPPRDVLCDARV